MAAARATRWSNAAFVAAFLVTLAFFYEVVAPFVLPVLVGALIVLLLEPVHERLVAALGGRRRLASLLSSCAVLLVVLLPSAATVYVLVGQALDLLGKARAWLGPEGMEALAGGQIPERLAPLVERIGPGIGSGLRDALNNASAWLTGFLAGLVGATTRLVLDAFVVVVSVYYFFLDGPRLLADFSRLSPLESRYEQEFFREFRDVAHTMVYVNLVTAGVQGVVGGLGFLLADVGNPVGFGALMAVLSLVPILGTSLVWLPAGVGLLLGGRPIAGLFLLAWGLVVIASVDNLLRPLLAKGRIRLHPLLIFVTIFGGMAAFGPVGMILGPLVGSIFTAMVRIWRRDFVPRISGETKGAPDGQEPDRREGLSGLDATSRAGS